MKVIDASSVGMMGLVLTYDEFEILKIALGIADLHTIQNRLGNKNRDKLVMQMHCELKAPYEDHI